MAAARLMTGPATNPGSPFHVAVCEYDCPGWSVNQVGSRIIGPPGLMIPPKLAVAAWVISNLVEPVRTAIGWSPTLVSVKVIFTGWPAW